MKIYVASSWRNGYQPIVVQFLRNQGHEVYDFRNPPKGTGFDWGDIDENWLSWSTEDFVKALQHPIAADGFDSDFSGMAWADVCVLVLPAGRSANSEAGYMRGAGKPVFVFSPEACEPELMYLMHNGVFSSELELAKAIVSEETFNEVAERKGLQEKILVLENWKAEALAVMPDMQAIGKAIAVPLGQSVHDKILPAILALQDENRHLREQITGRAEPHIVPSPLFQAVREQFPNLPAGHPPGQFIVGTESLGPQGNSAIGTEPCHAQIQGTPPPKFTPIGPAGFKPFPFQFQFVYYTATDPLFMCPLTHLVKAPEIGEAVRLLLQNPPEGLHKLDYEVRILPTSQTGTQYLDIRFMPELKEYF